jgi:hypothetical protein
VALLEAAGFKVTEVNGIWNCAEGVRRYEEANSLTGDIELRCQSAEDDPVSSFIWWIVGEKTGPAREDLEALVEKVVARSFKPFAAARFRNRLGRIHSIEGTELILEVTSAERGVVFYGPWVPLRGGRYRAEFDLKFLDGAGPIELDVVANSGKRQLAKVRVEASADGEWRKHSLEFDLDDYTEGVETRAISHGANALLRFGTQIMRI